MNKNLKIARRLIKLASILIQDRNKTASIYNFTYTVPNDLPTMIYDFYMLQALSNKNYTLQNYNQLINDDEGIGRHRQQKYVQAKINVNDALKKLTEHLKNEFMNMLYYQVARQFSHLGYFISTLGEKWKKNFNNNELDFINKYYLLQRKLTDVYSLEESSFSFGKQMINKFHPNRKFFITLAKKAFNYIIYGGGYGGPNWANICDAYLMFGSVPDQIAIDHVFDLQHNTGNVFYKYPKYSKVHDIINKILNEKRDAVYPVQYLDKCSPSIKNVCRYLCYQDYGVGEEYRIEKQKQNAVKNVIESVKQGEFIKDIDQNTFNFVFDYFMQKNEEWYIISLLEMTSKIKLDGNQLNKLFNALIKKSEKIFDVNRLHFLTFHYRGQLNEQQIKKAADIFIKYKQSGYLYDLINQLDDEYLRKAIKFFIEQKQNMYLYLSVDKLNKQQIQQVFDIFIDKNFFNYLIRMFINDKLTADQRKQLIEKMKPAIKLLDLITIMNKDQRIQAIKRIVSEKPDEMTEDYRKSELKDLIKNNALTDEQKEIIKASGILQK